MKGIIPLEILRYFLENPFKEMHLRELAKELKLSPFAVKKYIEMLLNENLILDERKANLRLLKANTGSIVYKQLKVAFSVSALEKSGLVAILKSKIPNLSCIVLFGSMAKGEDTPESDVDIVVIGKKTPLDLSSVEKFLGREVNMHVFSWSSWSEKAKNDEPFYSDVIGQGLPLFGELPIVRWK